ncbi:MAG TPA: DUF448 domain-containing protein [Myxococcales bacterium]|nr:DUF448 domain-containing protein [Myxococcales bacterium]
MSPTRTCIGCGARSPQGALVRLALRDGRVVLDPARRQPGRGAYLCGVSCARKALSRRAFGKAFRGASTAEASLLEQVQQLLGASAA